MRNVMRKTLVTVGIAVALMVGTGIGVANAAPMVIPELPIPELPIPELPELPIPELPL